MKKRVLRWKRMEWKEGVCAYCVQKKPLVGANVVWMTKVKGDWGVCAQCTYKWIDRLEKAASELRAASMGGMWEEERMVEE